MITIATSLGVVHCNKFTRRHSQQGGHRDPSENKELLTALKQNKFDVVDRLESQWRGYPATNLVLVIRTAIATFLVILKTVKKHLLLVTAYPAHDRQLAKYFSA